MKYGETTCHFEQKLIWFIKAFWMAQVKHVRKTLMNVIPTLASTTQPAWMTSMATLACASLVILVSHLLTSSWTTGNWPSTYLILSVLGILNAKLEQTTVKEHHVHVT
jgi:hypothetical protein